jgi:hypothetical protein
MEGNKMWEALKPQKTDEEIEKKPAIETHDESDEFGNYVEEQEEDDREKSC